MIGQVFGRLTVTGVAPHHVMPNGKRSARVFCKCSCGNDFVANTYTLKKGGTKSCGCLIKENKGAPKRVEPKRGDKFGNLSIVRETDRVTNPCGTHQRVFLCKCDCGNEVAVRLTALTKSNGTKSCGCLGKHGGTGTPEYHAWENMVQRCTNPNHPQYCDYGARGIAIEPAFRDFPTFLKEVGNRPTDKHSLDRLDNSIGYVPGNLGWVPRDIQNLNRRNNKLYEFKGQSLPLRKWAEILDVPEKTLWSRINVGHWPVEKALTTPKK